MLEKMGRDDGSDSCCAFGDDVHLIKQVSVVVFGHLNDG